MASNYKPDILVQCLCTTLALQLIGFCQGYTKGEPSGSAHSCKAKGVHLLLGRYLGSEVLYKLHEYH